ncbi:hypothetical protein TL16_g03801 [Triparma laevis f. inornata]|uniref:Calmodulin n=1 Tax=Triparma laevis f. inornata TaxID=1714386 RepID=A0A9W7A9J6_9STRA|nr:hypothetical protein TL16_g03801 [Triparma laevis f. inornata]
MADHATPLPASLPNNPSTPPSPGATSPSCTSPSHFKETSDNVLNTVLKNTHNLTSLPSPLFPVPNLSSHYEFPHPHKTKPPNGVVEEWLRRVVEESPYNDLQGPVRERNVPTPGEIANKKMLQIKKHLGIPDTGLLEGVDPAATRTKSGLAPKSADEAAMAKKRKDIERERKRKEKRARLSKGLGKGEEGSVTTFDSSISKAASKASALTLESLGGLSRSSHGRRGGIFMKQEIKKIKKPLKLTKEDEEVVESLGEVPIEMWQNELSHLQLVLGVDDVHRKEDFALTSMKINNPSAGGGGRRPENVAMDDYELPKYKHDDIKDTISRSNEDEFVRSDVADEDDVTVGGTKAMKEEVGQVAQEYFARKAILNMQDKRRESQIKQKEEEKIEANTTPLAHGLVNSEGGYEPIPYKPLENPITTSAQTPQQPPNFVTPSPTLSGPPVSGHQSAASSSRAAHRKPKATRTSKQNAKAKKLMDFLNKVNTEQSTASTDTNPLDVDHFSIDPPGIQRSDEMQQILKKRLEDNLGRGFWNDEIGSTLARDLDSSNVYNPRSTLLKEKSTSVSLQSQLPPPVVEEEEEEVKKPTSATPSRKRSSSGLSSPPRSRGRSRADSRASSRSGSPNRTTRSRSSSIRPNTSAATGLTRPNSKTSSRPNTSDSEPSKTPRPATAPIPNTTLKKSKTTASLTETISITHDTQDAAWLRTQALKALSEGRKDEATKLFGEAAAILISQDADIRTVAEVFAYAPHVHVAANLIQSKGRKRFAVKCKAQTKFASLFRGHVSRKAKKLRLTRRIVCATCIQRGWWRYLAHKLYAATVIQTMTRRVLAKQIVAQMRLENNAAILIQCLFRKKIAMRVFQFHLLRWRSTIVMQANWRGFACRLGRYRALWELYSWHCELASRVQKRVRGWQGRCKARERRLKIIHFEHVRYQKEKKSIDAAVKLALSRSKFFLESDEGKEFVRLEKSKILAAKKESEDAEVEMTPEQKIKFDIMTVFETFDLDSSGSIDTDELNELLTEMGIKLSEDDLTEASKEMDDDESGEIGFEEFYTWFKLYQEDHQKKSFFPSFSLSGMMKAVDTRKAKNSVQLHFTREAARVAQSHFRARHPPNWRCTSCRHPFALFGDYARHFTTNWGNRVCSSIVSHESEASTKNMLFPNFVITSHQHKLQKRAEIEHTRFLDESLSVGEHATLSAIKAKTTFLIKQGKRDMLRLKNFFITRRNERNKKMKEESKKWEEIRELDIKEAFEAFDTDSGGSIDAAEFKEILTAMSIHLSEEDFDLALHRIDKDKSGEIEYPEFQAWYVTREEDYKKKHSALANATKALSEKMAANSVAAAAAEKTAKRFLVERARVRAELETRRIFRKTRLPNYGWCSDSWLHEQKLEHLTLDYDLKKNEKLRRSLRVVEEKCEVPASIHPPGKKRPWAKKEDDEEPGLKRAQYLAEQECRRWLKSASGKRAVKRQSYVLNSLVLEKDRTGGRKRGVLDVFDAFEDGDIDIEDAYRSIRRKGIWLGGVRREGLFEALSEAKKDKSKNVPNGFNYEVWNEWVSQHKSTWQEKVVGGTLNLGRKIDVMRFGKWKEASRAYFINRARLQARAKYFSERFLPGGVNRSRHATPDGLVLGERGSEGGGEGELVPLLEDELDETKVAEELKKVNRAKARREAFENQSALIERQVLINDSELEAATNLKILSRKRAGKDILKREVETIKSARVALRCVQVGLTNQGKKIELARHMFRIFDCDESGGIDDEELGPLCKILCVPLNEAENLALIKGMDKDLSGVVDFKEFVTWFLKEGQRRKWRSGRGLRLIFGWWLRGQKKRIRQEAYQLCLNRVCFLARNAVVASLEEEQNRLNGVAHEQRRRGFSWGGGMSRPGSRGDGGGLGVGFATVDFSGVTVMDEVFGAVLEEEGEEEDSSDLEFVDSSEEEEEEGGEEGEEEKLVEDIENVEDIEDDDETTSLIQVSTPKLSPPRPKTPNKEILDGLEEGISPIAQVPSPIQDQDISMQQSIGAPSLDATNTSVQSFGYMKGVIGETEVSSRINTLMWKAESNAMASVSLFMKGEAGKAMLKLEIDKLKAINKLSSVGLVKPKDKLTRLRIAIRRKFALHESGEEDDTDMLFGVNNDYVQIDSGEVKYFLARVGVRGVWGGALSFPHVAEKDGLNKVTMITFEDVWEYLMESQEDFKIGGEGDDEERVAAEKANGFVLEKVKVAPLPRKAKKSTVRDDALESIYARARCAARRHVLETEGMLTEDDGWGGKGKFQSLVATKERHARVVERECEKAVNECLRTKRAEVPTLLKFLNARPGLKARTKREAFESIIKREDFGGAVMGIEPEVVNVEEFEKIWKEALGVKWSFWWKVGVWKSCFFRGLWRALHAPGYVRRERIMITLYECRKLTREKISQRALKKMVEEEEERELWREGGREEEEKEEEATHGGSSWVNAAVVLEKEVL